MPAAPETWFRRKGARIAAGLGVVAIVGWFLLPRVLGLGLAMVDHARGRAALKRYGEPMIGADTFHRLMRERYEVSVDEAGCNISSSTIRYIEAYNWYADLRLRSRFGRDVWAECQREAASTTRDALE